jgi:hydrogenase maturation protease
MSHPRSSRKRRPPPKPSDPAGALVSELIQGARRIAVLGVGSDLRGDDAAGVEVARRLAAFCAARPRLRPGLRLAAFDGGAAPENLTGEIARFAPDLVVLVDAAFLGSAPGAVEVVPAERIAGFSFSTHMLPAPVVLDYLRQRTGCRTAVLAIQIAQKEPMSRPSREVAAAVRRLVAAFQGAVIPRERAPRSP